MKRSREGLRLSAKDSKRVWGAGVKVEIVLQAVLVLHWPERNGFDGRC